MPVPAEKKISQLYIDLIDQNPNIRHMENECKVDGCARKSIARKMCALHWQRWRLGRPLDLPVRYASVFARGWTSNGYKFMVTPDGREMSVHRYKMEQKIGRKLHIDECVHHINHDKLDNRIENLEVIPRDLHTSHHRKHASPCYVCGLRCSKGGHGLCSVHAARVRNFARKFKVSIPPTPTARAVFFMSIAKGLEDETMIPIMERLQLENLVIA